MTCYSPLTGYRSKHVNPETGKRSIVFNPKDGFRDLAVQVPCGRCIGCRLDYSREWATRCMHESQMHEKNSFITLTYSPEKLPSNNSISKVEVQKFFKRLRKHLEPFGVPISYFACGEYGELNNRPHYHAIVFGWDFPDKQLYSVKNNHPYYRSASLERIWGFGYSIIGDVTFDSCAYVARYVTKKFKSSDPKKVEEKYKIFDKETGEIHQLQPEFCLMSRKPPIGRRWYEKYGKDTAKDFVTMQGTKLKIPKMYDKLHEQIDPEGLEVIKQQRQKAASERKADNTIYRLQAREKVKLAQAKQLTRTLENDT